MTSGVANSDDRREGTRSRGHATVAPSSASITVEVDLSTVVDLVRARRLAALLFAPPTIVTSSSAVAS